MSTSTVPYRPCPHGLDPFGCPACTDEMWQEHQAIQLASRDVETVERWRLEFECCLGSEDAARAESGQAVVA